jgi:hypothetical protein
VGDLLSRRLQAAARRWALCLAGALLAGVGLLFLTLGAWHGLALWQGPVAAGLVLGVFYLGAGLLVLSALRRPVLPPPPPPEPGPQPMLKVLAAFLAGLEAGATARRR